MFYTYAYLREDKTPYYIGKGKGNRLYDHRGKNCIPPKDKSKIIKLKQNLTEEEAFKHEIYMIAVFGKKCDETGILMNIALKNIKKCDIRISSDHPIVKDIILNGCTSISEMIILINHLKSFV